MLGDFAMCAGSIAALGHAICGVAGVQVRVAAVRGCSHPVAADAKG